MKRILGMLMVSCVVWIAGCRSADPDRPPEVIIGDSVCDQCNMIISDERWATATIVQGPRGPEPRLFDDFNCQVNYEEEHPQAKIVTRWSRSYTTTEWIRTEQAIFLISPSLRTPMGSNTAAFATQPDAQDIKADLNGEVMPFDSAWQRLGFTQTSPHNNTTTTQTTEQEHHDEP